VFGWSRVIAGSRVDGKFAFENPLLGPEKSDVVIYIRQEIRPCPDGVPAGRHARLVPPGTLGPLPSGPTRRRSGPAARQPGPHAADLREEELPLPARAEAFGPVSGHPLRRAADDDLSPARPGGDAPPLGQMLREIIYQLKRNKALAQGLLARQTPERRSGAHYRVQSWDVEGFTSCVGVK
jgi:hypothetical protein